MIFDRISDEPGNPEGSEVSLLELQRFENRNESLIAVDSSGYIYNIYNIYIIYTYIIYIHISRCRVLVILKNHLSHLSQLEAALVSPSPDLFVTPESGTLKKYQEIQYQSMASKLLMSLEGITKTCFWLMGQVPTGSNRFHRPTPGIAFAWALIPSTTIHGS